MPYAKISKLTLLDDRPKAIKVEQVQARNMTSGHIWLPKSQIKYQRKLGMSAADQALGKNPEIVVEIPEWLAIEKELDYD